MAEGSVCRARLRIRVRRDGEGSAAARLAAAPARNRPARPLSASCDSRERSACAPSKSAASVGLGRLRCQNSTPKVADPRTLLASITSLEASEHTRAGCFRGHRPWDRRNHGAGRMASGDVRGQSRRGSGSKRSRLGRGPATVFKAAAARIIRGPSACGADVQCRWHERKSAPRPNRLDEMMAHGEACTSWVLRWHHPMAAMLGLNDEDSGLGTRRRASRPGGSEVKGAANSKWGPSVW